MKSILFNKFNPVKKLKNYLASRSGFALKGLKAICSPFCSIIFGTKIFFAQHYSKHCTIYLSRLKSPELKRIDELSHADVVIAYSPNKLIYLSLLNYTAFDAQWIFLGIGRHHADFLNKIATDQYFYKNKGMSILYRFMHTRICSHANIFFFCLLINLQPSDLKKYCVPRIRWYFIFMITMGVIIQCSPTVQFTTMAGSKNTNAKGQYLYSESKEKKYGMETL